MWGTTRYKNSSIRNVTSFNKECHELMETESSFSLHGLTEVILKVDPSFPFDWVSLRKCYVESEYDVCGFS